MSAPPIPCRSDEQYAAELAARFPARQPEPEPASPVCKHGVALDTAGACLSCRKSWVTTRDVADAVAQERARVLRICDDEMAYYAEGGECHEAVRDARNRIADPLNEADPQAHRDAECAASSAAYERELAAVRAERDQAWATTLRLQQERDEAQAKLAALRHVLGEAGR